uniref:EF-hand domain-containing protein n=1 Tax=Haptolina brevifila TaxID=156173 RepID=A0A7S2GZQ1_9EUKA|mmetsp:Transcript_49530/g.98617  ORF Transcript_49530/g.98617 Transcript_49530/m.98617 type:complete len:299 (+) Transcript_49530:41-937(+)
MGLFTPKKSRENSSSKKGKQARFDEQTHNEQDVKEKEEREAAKKIEAMARGRQARLIVEGKAKNTRFNEVVPSERSLKRAVSFGSGIAVGISAGPVSLSPLEDVMALLKQCTEKCIPSAKSSPGEDGEEEEEVPLRPSKLAAANAEAPARHSGADKELLKFPSNKKPLSPVLNEQVEALFKAMDFDGDGTITFQEARKFWGSNFSKVNAQAMFNEVDDDINGSITYEEWIDFWRNVVAQPEYSEEDVVEELMSIKAGGSWVDWNDGRETGETPLTLAIKAEKNQIAEKSVEQAKELQS